MLSDYTEQHTPSRMLQLPEVLSLVGLGRTTLWRMVKAGTFPAPVKLGATRRIAWFADDIGQWQANLPRTRLP